MAMQTDVKAKTLAASGDVFTLRCRVKSLVVEPGGTAGSVEIKDGGSGGTSLFTINTPANGQVFNVLLPGEGVLCQTSAYATLTNAKVTVFYG